MAEVHYQFRLETDQEKIDGVFGSSNICHIIEGFSSDYMEQTTLVYGRLRSLFGEPSYETNDLENQYCYYITATSEDGTERLIYAYSASSGPAVGGKHDEMSAEAAKQLVQYILQAEPADYDYEGYYLDGPSKVHMWVEDGVPYVEEEELNLSDEEFGELFRQVKGLG